MINVQGLIKHYPSPRIKKKAPGVNQGLKGLFNITFRVNQAEAFGFLGPNGAGKTTMIRHLMGFIKPDDGFAQIKGFDCWQDSLLVKEVVSYLPGELNFLEHMSGAEFLNLMSGLHGDRPVFLKRRNSLVKKLDLNIHQPIRKMSKGMKQKLGIIYTLMLDAEVLILDEPTSGLDPLMQKIFIDLVLEEKNRGKTVFISSHMFSEVERICDRVGIIRAGELVAVEKIQKLRQAQRKIFEITLEDEGQFKFLSESGLAIIWRQGPRLAVEIQGNINPFLNILAQVEVKEFSQRTTELEEAFMNFYEGEGVI